MQTSKKIFSVVLAFVMLVSVFTVTTSAGAPAPADGAVVSIAYEVVNADGDVVTSVNPGETVTVNVYANAAADTDTLNSATISIFYDSDVYTYVDSSLTWKGLASWVDTSNSSIDIYQEGGTYYDAIVALGTTEELALGWDTQAYILAIATGNSDYAVQANADVAMLSIDLKVADDAAAGTAANIGCYDGAHYVSRTKSYCNIKTASTGSRISSGAVDMPETVALTVATPAPAYELAITPLKNQIRYNKYDDGSFKEINVRARASIDAAELQELLGVTANDDIEAAIVDVGFVFGADVDAATAKTVVNGTTVDGYTKKSVEYIQNTGSAYVYTCLVNEITDDKIVAASDFECIAYIVLNIGGTNYDFYFTNDEVVAVSPLGMYNATYERANTTYGWTLAAK